MILARNTITLTQIRDIESVTRYYKLQSSTSSAPAKPTEATPSGWVTTEPSYTTGSTNSLYTVEKTTFTDGTFEYSEVSLSSSYEAAKAAYNKATATQDNLDNLEIGGRNLYAVCNQVNGYIASSGGTITGATSTGKECTSAYIPVSEGEHYILQSWVPSIGSSQKTWIAYQFYSNNTGTTVGTRPGKYGTAGETYLAYTNITVPANATYLRVSYSKFEDGYCKIEKGTKATDWTPAPEDIQEQIDDVKAQSVEYIVGSQTSATGAWKGATSDASLETGKTIAYKLPYAGSGDASLTLTLADGTTTAAVPVYLNTTRVTTHFGAGAVINMTYDGAAWRAASIPNTNTNYYDRTAYKASVTAAGAIAAGRIGVFNTAGKLVLLSTTPFDITSPILYIGTAYTASALTQTNNYTMWGTPFSLANTKSGFSGTAGKPVYIVGTLNGNIFTPDSAVFTCTIPTTDDGKHYMLLGFMSTAVNAVLSAEHPIYIHYNGKFQTTADAARDSADNAMTAANGKNKVFHQASTVIPASDGLKTGDTWFVTNQGYKMRTWNGSQWVDEQFDSDAIVAGAIKTGHLDAGAVTAAKIDVEDLFAQNITAKGSIKTPILYDGAYNGTNYNNNNTAGSIINLKDGKLNIGGKLKYDATNGLSINGTVTCSNGTIGGFDITGNAIMHSFDTGTAGNTTYEFRIQTANTTSSRLMYVKKTVPSQNIEQFLFNVNYEGNVYSNSLTLLCEGYGDTISMMYRETASGSFAAPIIRSDTNGAAYLGSGNYRWHSVYCADGAFNGSDRKIKNHIKYLEGDSELENFIYSLKPVMYTLKSGEGKRRHMGLYAQDVSETAHKTIGDIAAYQATVVEQGEDGQIVDGYFDESIDDEQLSWSLNYSEFIAPMIAVIQKQNKRIEALEQQLISKENNDE